MKTKTTNDMKRIYDFRLRMVQWTGENFPLIQEFIDTLFLRDGSTCELLQYANINDLDLVFTDPKGKQFRVETIKKGFFLIASPDCVCATNEDAIRAGVALTMNMQQLENILAPFR